MITAHSNKKEVVDTLSKFIPAEHVLVLERRVNYADARSRVMGSPDFVLKIIVQRNPTAIQAAVTNQMELTKLGFQLDFYGGTSKAPEGVEISIKK